MSNKDDYGKKNHDVHDLSDKNKKKEPVEELTDVNQLFSDSGKKKKSDCQPTVFPKSDNSNQKKKNAAHHSGEKKPAETTREAEVEAILRKYRKQDKKNSGKKKKEKKNIENKDRNKPENKLVKSSSTKHKMQNKADSVKKTSKKTAKDVAGFHRRFVETVKKKKEEWPLWKKILFCAASLIILIILFISIYSIVIIANAPEINPDNIYSYISQESTIFDKDNNAVDNVFVAGGHRTNIKYEDIPEDMVNAVVSIEDKKFWTHHGFNFIRIMGAIKDSVFSGGQVSGTSTITQQLARNVFLKEEMSEHSMKRKIVEAYYTVQIEKKLSKEQIMEAYLNTVYFGFDCYGIKTAANRYFHKSAKNLTLLECAALAALPQKPDSYALVKTIDVGKASKSMKNLLAYNSTYAYLYNGDASEERRNQTLNNMESEGYINSERKEDALSKDLKDSMHIVVNQTSYTSYFVDYCINDVINDLMEEKGYSYDKAHDVVYSGGLRIRTKLDTRAQKIITAAFNDDSNFPSATNIPKDSYGNVLDKYGNLILYNYNYLFDSKKRFIVSGSSFKKNENGSMTLYKGKFLNFYKTDSGDITVDVKSMCTYVNYIFCTIESATLSIPSEYKTLDSEGNLIIDASFFKKYPDFFEKDGSTLRVSKENYTIKTPVKQPQSAMVIVDNETGAVSAMVGGRSITGKLLYNRATKARQPGSSIKPLAMYSSALQLGADAAKTGTPMTYKGTDTSSYGSYLTASSQIHDSPIQGSIVNGKSWPSNWYTGYKGYMSLRKSVEQSVNVNAVRMYYEVGSDYATEQLKKFGITSVVEDGDVNDMNPSALALGGMTYGISPVELASAYTTFPNRGIHKSCKSYTEVQNSQGKTILKNEDKDTKVLDEGVAFVMQDILRTTVTEGLGKNASISGAQVGGKTGTTTDNYDMWFAGFTSKYSAALWWGNDYNIEMTGTSDNTAAFWGKIMNQVIGSSSYLELPEKPDDVIYSGGEYYVEGTH